MIYEDNGQIIVDELRPMSEAPQREWIMVYINKKIFPAYIKEDYMFCNSMIYKPTQAKGWLPMPIYRPKVE